MIYFKIPNYNILNHMHNLNKNTGILMKATKDKILCE